MRRFSKRRWDAPFLKKALGCAVSQEGVGLAWQGRSGRGGGIVTLTALASAEAMNSRSSSSGVSVIPATVEINILPSRFRPQYFLARTGVT
jgi:hypothetical protein